jgi:hypothetical protein
MSGSGLWISPDELGDYSNTEYAYEAASAASYLLWSMSGRKFTGPTTVTERYACVLRNNRLGPSTKTNSPVLFGGDVYNIPSGDFDEYSELVADGMSPESRIILRGRPVTKIHTIRNRLGKYIDSSQYYLVDHSTVQISAGTPWTPCNTEITYTYGAPIPLAAKMAARKLAIEFAKLWSDDPTCALPQRVTSITRQGVSYTVLDQQDFIDELKTGMYEIDLFLKTVNPDKARAKARVFSVDNARARRYTPKALYYPTGPKDIVITGGQTGTITLALADINAEFLVTETTWTPSITARSYSGLRSFQLPPSAVSVNRVAQTITITADYASCIAVLGMADPGRWDLFVSRPDLSDPSIEDVVLVTSGNLSISLVS